MKSSSCTNGQCYCGAEVGGCLSSDRFYTDKLDPKPNTLGLQRTKDEVCEQITEFYNPKYITNHPLMINGSDLNGNPTYELEYSDNKGNQTKGTYQCLGKSTKYGMITNNLT